MTLASQNSIYFQDPEIVGKTVVVNLQDDPTYGQRGIIPISLVAEDDIEKLYIGACLKMGIGPVEDLSELFQVLFGLGEEKDEDKPLQYYA